MDKRAFLNKRTWVLFVGISTLTFTSQAYAFVATLATFLAVTFTISMSVATAISVAISMVVSMAISYAVSAVIGGPNAPGGMGEQRDPGNRTQIPPATSNKLPVVYGDSWIGGTVIDLSITNNDQTLYYVIALSEVTNTNPPDCRYNYFWGCLFCREEMRI